MQRRFGVRKQAYSEKISFRNFWKYTDSLIIYLSSTFQITAINPAAERTLAWPKKVVLGQDFQQLCALDFLESPLAEGIEKIQENKFVHGIKTSNKDGSLHLIWEITCVEKNKQFSGFMLVARKSKNNKMIKTEKTNNFSSSTFLETIIANLPCHVYWKDRAGVYLGCNDRQAKSAGFIYGTDVVGKTDFDLCWKDRAPIFRKNDEEVMKNGVPIVIEEAGTLADGRPMTAVSHKVPLIDDNNEVIGILGISVDVTDRINMAQALIEAKESAEAANRTKLEFLSNIAHDFKTPINNLLGKTELMRGSISDPNLLTDLNEIEEIGNLMNRLVNDIRSFAKFDLISDDAAFPNEIDSLDLSASRMILAKDLPDLADLQLACLRKGLSKRESECIYYLIRGMTAKQIGKTMGLSNRTVEFYLDNAKSKLNCTNKFELISTIFESKV